jgi:hypothetical protein
MFELYELYRNSRFEKKELLKKIYTIRVEELNLNQPKVIGKYVEYWKNKVRDWQELITKNAVDISTEQYKQYKTIEKITNEAGSLLNLLSDINSLTTQLLSRNNFEVIKTSIKNRIQNYKTI